MSEAENTTPRQSLEAALQAMSSGAAYNSVSAEEYKEILTLSIKVAAAAEDIRRHSENSLKRLAMNPFEEFTKPQSPR